MGVPGARGHEQLDGAAERLARAVVEVALELNDGMGRVGVVVSHRGEGNGGLDVGVRGALGRVPASCAKKRLLRCRGSLAVGLACAVYLGQGNAQDAGGVAIRALAGAVARGKYAVGGGQRFGGAQRGHDGGARGRHELAVDGCGHKADPRRRAEVRDCGHRDGHHAVGTANGAVALAQGRHDHVMDS